MSGLTDPYRINQCGCMHSCMSIARSWGFTMATVYTLMDWLAPAWLLAFAAPQAFASAAVIAVMTVGMYAAGSGVVKDAYAKYDDAAVDLMNLVLHGLPFLAVTLMVARRRLVIGAAVPPSDSYVLSCGLVAYTYAASYFMTFSPIAQYEVHGISNTLVRTVVTVMQACTAALLGAYLQTLQMPVAAQTRTKLA